MTALVRGVAHGVTPCGPDTDRDQCPTNRRDGYAPTCRFPEADHFGHLCPEENDVNDLSARLVEAARQQIHQFDDDLEDWTPEARKATVAVLRELADTARAIGENVFSGTRLAALADQIEQAASACGVSSEADTTTEREMDKGDPVAWISHGTFVQQIDATSIQVRDDRGYWLVDTANLTGGER